MPFYDFNHTDYHELPLDYIMKLARESMGLELKVVGDKLNLVNDLGETLSSVTISYATKALTDVSGRELQTYLISAGVDANALVFTNGKGEVVYVTPAFATKAEKDINNRNLVDYVYSVTIAGDKVRVTSGDQVITDLTIPFATSSRYDFNSKDISTYAASLEVNGNLVELRDSMGRLLNSITVPYATAAATASDALHADNADHADKADHATDADAADYATLSTNATNAIQTAAIVGDNLVLTTYGGQVFTLTIPYAVRALKDAQSNEISKTYISNVTNDAQTGKLQFWDAEGNLLVELLPTVNKATHDSYDNLIADYIKQIIVSQNSDYMTVVHGTGTTDTIVIHYSETAWKDSNGNVIKNSYIKRLACIEDVVDGHYKLVAYNGDDPEAELFRIEIYAYAAQTDVNGKALTSYVSDLDITNNNIVVKDGENNTLETLPIPSYFMDTDDTQIELHRGSEMISNISVPCVQVTIADSDISPWQYNNTSLTRLTTVNMSSFATANALTDNVAVLVYYADQIMIAVAKSQIQRTNSVTTIFESNIENDKVWTIELNTTSTGQLMSCIGNVVDLSSGGGGGGGSTYILNLTDGQGNPARFDNAQQAGTVQLHLSGTAQDFSHVSALLQAGTVVIKDSASSLAHIECTNVSSTTLIVPCFNGNSFTRLKFEHQWSGNYRVSATQ